ncbi:MAG: hypothetical protein HY703_11080 [Gemmatimonadetes bacterium]|nr:hypothetical protein [Gemmatimonadota bacterium]
MTTRERLHHLVDELPESEHPTAVRVLEALARLADPVRWALDHAPPEDETISADEQAAVAEAREDVRTGRISTHEEIKRELGL